MRLSLLCIGTPSDSLGQAALRSPGVRLSAQAVPPPVWGAKDSDPANYRGTAGLDDLDQDPAPPQQEQKETENGNGN